MHLGCGHIAQAQTYAPGKVAQPVEGDGGQHAPRLPVDVAQHKPGQPDLCEVKQGRGQAVAEIQKGRGQVQRGKKQRSDNYSPEAPHLLESSLDVTPADEFLKQGDDEHGHGELPSQPLHRLDREWW